MIIKIKSHKRATFGRLLNYMVHNKDRLFDKDRRSFAITHNLKGNSVKRWEKQFKDNEATRLRLRSDSVILTHEILSWHRDDAKELTLAKMEEMAREYIRQRNPNGMYVAVPHFDKDHYHIHILASGVEYKTGKSLRLSMSDLHKLKVEIQNYQILRFPELSKSIVKHGKSDKTRLTDKEYQIKLRTNRDTKKEQVEAILKTCYKKADSRETFFTLLAECGLHPYERGGKITGIVSEGIKFRLNRLGYSEERFIELDKAKIRGKELTDMRNKEVNKPRTVERNEEMQNDVPPEPTENITEEPQGRVNELQEVRGSEHGESRGRELNEIGNNVQHPPQQETRRQSLDK